MPEKNGTTEVVICRGAQFTNHYYDAPSWIVRMLRWAFKLDRLLRRVKRWKNGVSDGET